MIHLEIMTDAHVSSSFTMATEFHPWKWKLSSYICWKVRTTTLRMKV